MSRPEYVDPWVNCLQSLVTVHDQMMEWTYLPEPSVIWGEIQEFDRTLRTLGDLLADSLPLPVPEETTDQAVDAAVERVVIALIEDTELPTDAVEIAQKANRVISPDDSMTVPLSTVGPTVGNWFVVLRVVSERLDDLASGVERIAGRSELYDRPDSAAALTDVSEALQDTAATARNLASQALWLHPPDGLVDAKYQRIREYAIRTAKSYNPYA